VVALTRGSDLGITTRQLCNTAEWQPLHQGLQDRLAGAGDCSGRLSYRPQPGALGERVNMPEASFIAPGARIESRQRRVVWCAAWAGARGQQVVDVVGVSPFLRETEARFLVEVSQAAGSLQVLQPEDPEW